jgi:hypothetical protein
VKSDRLSAARRALISPGRLGTTAGRAGIDCKSKLMPSVTVYFAMSA